MVGGGGEVGGRGGGNYTEENHGGSYMGNCFTLLQATGSSGGSPVRLYVDFVVDVKVYRVLVGCQAGSKMCGDNTYKKLRVLIGPAGSAGVVEGRRAERARNNVRGVEECCNVFEHKIFFLGLYYGDVVEYTMTQHSYIFSPVTHRRNIAGANDRFVAPSPQAWMPSGGPSSLAGNPNPL